MLHYNNLGLSVTKHDDDWFVFLNLNLLTQLQDSQKRAEELLEELEALRN